MYYKLLLMFVLLKHSFSTKLPVIRNLKHPACVNCLHFISDRPNNHVFARCKMFGEMDVITGSINYDFAKLSRESDSKCGVNGTFYEEKGKE